MSNSVMTKSQLCQSDNSLLTEKKNISFTLPVSNFEVKNRSDIYTQPFITGIVKECFDIMCQEGEYTFEIPIDGVNMVENKRRTTQSANVKELTLV